MVATPLNVNLSRPLTLPDLRFLTALVRVALADYYQQRSSLRQEERQLALAVLNRLHNAEFESLLRKMGYPEPMLVQALWIYSSAQRRAVPSPNAQA